MVLQNHQKLIEMTSNIFNTIAFGVGFKCPRKIHLNTQCEGGGAISKVGAGIFAPEGAGGGERVPNAPRFPHPCTHK